MKTSFLILLLVCCISCKKSGIKNDTANAEVTKNIQPARKEKIEEKGTEEGEEAEDRIVYSTEFVKIIGDSTVDSTKIYFTKIKFEPYISFEDFKAATVFTGQKAKIDYKSHSIAREYKTVITEDYKSGSVNFAGHYCLISWMCGAPCQHFALVDVRDGKVYDGQFAQVGFDFRKDSRMLIVNPPDSSGFYFDMGWAHPEIWIWNEDLKKFEQRNAQ